MVLQKVIVWVKIWSSQSQRNLPEREAKRESYVTHVGVSAMLPR